MRRLFAYLLLAVFSFALISPLALATTVSSLPSCCRRNGKHHCNVADRNAAAGMRAQCQVFPKSGVLPAAAKSTPLTTASQAQAPRSFGLIIQTRDCRLVDPSLGHVRKRGPPYRLSEA